MLDAYVFNTLLNIAIYFYLTKSNIPKNTPSPNTIETRPYTIVTGVPLRRNTNRLIIKYNPLSINQRATQVKYKKLHASTHHALLSQQYTENYLVLLYIDGTYFANVIQKEHHLSRGDLRVVWSHEIGGAFL